ncbi:hypothetical protein KIF59_22310 [Enterobacter cloacae subsp. cloacae]|nr:hypothetical protein [Enterobacter cloacae subsp. cloacae]
MAFTRRQDVHYGKIVTTFLLSRGEGWGEGIRAPNLNNRKRTPWISLNVLTQKKPM